MRTYAKNWHTCVRSSKPEKFYGRALNAAQRTQGEVLDDKARGDVGAHGFWKRGRTTIFDVQICDTEAKSYGTHTLKKFWRAQHVGKRISMMRHVSKDIETSPPKHAHATEKQNAGTLAAKWTWQYSHMASFVQTQMCIAIVH